MEKTATTFTQAQKFVKDFTIVNNWSDQPNIDKFDHLHEELVEMSKLLRYKNLAEREQALVDHHDELVDGIGDLCFAFCRLSNQLNIDIDQAFNLVKNKITQRYAEATEKDKR